MSTVQELELAIRQLSPGELAKLRTFIAELQNGEEDGDASRMTASGNSTDAEDRRHFEALKKLAIEATEAIQTSAKALPTLLAGVNASASLPIIQPAKYQSLDDWLTAFRKWGKSHNDITAIADDSRESIY